MTFDWLAFLQSVGADFVEGPAPNVRAGHLGIHCPRCGHDTKYHFSIEISSGRVRGCWRDQTHWMSPQQLVAELAQVSPSEARKILAGDMQAPAPEINLRELLRNMDAQAPDRQRRLPELEMPESMREFARHDAHPHQQRFVKYLADRGFRRPLAQANEFGLRWCSHGEWQQRLIFPLSDETGKLLGWTGRDITGTSPAKYRTHPAGDTAGRLVYFGLDDHSVFADTLLLVEGPMDALKVGWYAEPDTVHPVALLGLNVGTPKVALLSRLVRDYGRMVIALDREAEVQARELVDQLALLGAELAPALPAGVEDPGDLSGDQVAAWVAEIAG